VAVEADVFRRRPMTRWVLSCGIATRRPLDGPSADDRARQRPLGPSSRSRSSDTTCSRSKVGSTLRDVEPPVRQAGRGRPDVTQELEVAARLVDGQPLAHQLLTQASSRHTPRSCEREKAALRGLAIRAGRAHGPERDRSLSVKLTGSCGVQWNRTRAVQPWYELFPRSAGKGGKHGTFRDVEDCSPTSRAWASTSSTSRPSPHRPLAPQMGANNNPKQARRARSRGRSARGGGHKSIHPQLGTL